MGIHLGDLGLVRKRDPGVRRRTPYSNQEPITTTHKLARILQICRRIQSHEGGRVQIVVHQASLGTGQEGDPSFTSKAEPLHLQVPHQILQKDHNTQ